MCKHCKPKEAEPAAEAGNLTPLEIISGLVGFIRYTDIEVGSDGSDESISSLEGPLDDYDPSVVTGVTAIRAALALLANPDQEPAYRYFQNEEATWRVHPSGVVEARDHSESEWYEDTMSLTDLLGWGLPEIPNPDLSID
jgi:hypothetical protein